MRCAEGGTRTLKMLPSADFESAVFTNFTTSADFCAFEKKPARNASIFSPGRACIHDSANTSYGTLKHNQRHREGIGTMFAPEVLLRLRQLINFNIFPFRACNYLAHLVFDFCAIFYYFFVLFHIPAAYIEIFVDKRGLKIADGYFAG